MMHVLQDQLTAGEVERVAKLPKWAIDIMETLAIAANTRQQDLDEARAALAFMAGGGNEQTTTWVDPFGGHPVAVGVNPDLEHTLANGDKITVMLGTHGVVVAHSGSKANTLHVQPVVANEVRIVPGRPLTTHEEK